MLNGKKVNLLPLSSQQVREDKIRSQQKEVKSRKGLLLAKKRDIKQALASAGAVFMIWAKQLLQVEGLDLPIQVKVLLEEFKVVFPDELPKGLHLFMELNIKLIWCRELHFLIDQHTDVIQRKQKRFKGRLVSS